jgi:sugar phosphate isomerase/epimerase
MKSAVTVCLVPEARSGPFVFHDGLAYGCARAAAVGFDAVEIFPRSAETIDRADLKQLLAKHRLSVAAFGTGAGWVVRKLTLTSPDPAVRSEARRFIASIIELAGDFHASAIVGSMQGRLASDQNREQTFAWLRESLDELGDQAASHQLPLLLEPLNRYETNVFIRLGETAAFLRTLRTQNVRILADLFHMNIEETDMAAAIRKTGSLIGHIHFADSNRRAIGFGHTEIEPIVSAIREIGYNGYLSAESFPLPDADSAARQTVESFRRLTA